MCHLGLVALGDMLYTTNLIIPTIITVYGICHDHEHDNESIHIIHSLYIIATRHNRCYEVLIG